ncbi:MAG: DUF716 domain-containing protein [Longimicrobiales bacterium]|nr:DUF716 domain-containing protein [Longimicrobiales bacterium]
MSLSGTFTGHFIPAVLLMIWAGWWIWQTISTRGAYVYRTGTIEEGAFMPWGKAILPFIGVLAELAPHGFAWKPSMMNNYQHAVMYVWFILAGVVDILARKGRVSRSATYIAYAAASLNTALLFAGHGHMGGVPDTVHQILLTLFALSAIIAIAEIRFPNGGIAWLRIGTLLLTGIWLVWIAWILYRSGYDLMDHKNQMKSWFFFSATAVGVSVAVLTLHQMLGAPKAEDFEAPSSG